jgi:hypothetical protein
MDTVKVPSDAGIMSLKIVTKGKKREYRIFFPKELIKIHGSVAIEGLANCQRKQD